MKTQLNTAAAYTGGLIRHRWTRSWEDGVTDKTQVTLSDVRFPYETVYSISTLRCGQSCKSTRLPTL
ncbi:hypothetical protein SRHO_G00223940 [Serrasalmus rhombeus]